MQTRFVSFELEMPSDRTTLQQTILTHLSQHGEPLRWAITGIAGDRLHIEAVVTTTPAFHLPGVSVKLV